MSKSFALAAFAAVSLAACAAASPQSPSSQAATAPAAAAGKPATAPAPAPAEAESQAEKELKRLTLEAALREQQLQTELANVEEMLAAARRYYNSTVATYNATQNTVPSNMVAKFGDFSEAEFFEEEDEAVRAAPQVSFEK